MTTSVTKILKTIMIIIFFFIYGSLAYLFLYFNGIDLNNLSNFWQTFTLILIEIVEILILFFLYYNDMIKDLKDFKSNFKTYIKFGLKWWLIGLLIMYASNIIIYFITNTGASNEEIIQDQIMKFPIYMLFSTSITAPFTEEIVFRKSIRDVFKNNYLFIIISFLVFGGVHVLSSKTLIEMLYIIPYGIFGGVFAYMYVKTNNIFTSMSMHFIHNFLIVSFSIITLLLGV